VQLRIRYETKDANREVITTPFAIIAWERQYKRSIGDGNGLSMEDLAFLCWEAVKASGEVVPPFDHWAAGLRSINLESGDESRPTSPEPSAG